MMRSASWSRGRHAGRHAQPEDHHAREERGPIDPPMLGTANSANPAVTTTGPKVRGSLAP